ncbi:KpsF/GutQ family sugar-phosphate isomerase [Rhizobium glycinendophyticum]|uniref:KpsF/GutQ family sugar-phosphate isomerase n=1 Tax=Rhizobium glycinendophyticum TaxID=2589807 RepID=A0A504UYX3_9HYPH|nr:KpsF/GutQ family sugar-phosphate isomerase [Rhizobium glycinendophyticum]TPP11981.1 KpsF/GutQ family sugar-phosphate isomerase [Rhizobium glycinendophyticum]
MIKRAVNLVEASATQSAIRVVATEREGLKVLEDVLAGPLAAPFGNAVKAIGDISGRVIVTGVGKSGHIGSKIAATFASTGTPAFFVHPSEANHGDLGMIAQDDAILAISWGGETTELQGILAFSRRFSIPLIAITSGENSTLARNADVVLLMPKVTEACPHGLAPTTSAVLQLAIGDAIAIALLEARGFSPSDFRTFHPGGKLGAALTHVRDIMHTGERLPLVPLGTSMPEAVKTLSHKRFGCVGVVDAGGKLCGIVTEGDMARNLARDLSVLNVEHVMTANPKVIQGDALATTAAAMINKLGIGALMVVDEHDHPIGLIHFHDLLRIGVA